MERPPSDLQPQPWNEALPTPAKVQELKPLTVRIPTALRMTGIGRSKLYELMASGDIQVVKIGSATLIPVASLEALIAKNRR